MTIIRKPCPRCKGEGERNDKECGRCLGTGFDGSAEAFEE